MAGKIAGGVLTLEVALLGGAVAREGSLGLLVLELVEDLPVGDVAHLVVLVDQLALLEADTALALGHHGIAGLVGLADVAVDAAPAVLALARVAVPGRSVLVAVGQGATQRRGAVVAPEAGGAVALAICLDALGELVALEVVEVAVEAGGAAVGAVVAQREEVEGVLGGCVVSKRLARRGRARQRQRDQKRGGGSSPWCASHGAEVQRRCGCRCRCRCRCGCSSDSPGRLPERE